MADTDREKWQRELGSRLREARKRAGLTLQEVGDRLGVSKQLASHRETQRSEITAFDLARFVGIADADGHWLLTGRAAPAPSLPDGSIRMVPRFEPQTVWTVAEALSAGLTRNPAKWFATMAKDYPQVAVQAPVSAMAFAITAPDRGLAPEIDSDDTVVIDGDVRPAAEGIGLFALLATRELLLRRFEPGKSGDLEPPFTLTASSDLFPERQVTEAHRPYCMGGVAAIMRLYQPQKSTARLAGQVSAG